MMKTKYFDYQEFIYSETAVRNKIDNNPKEESIILNIS